MAEEVFERQSMGAMEAVGLGLAEGITAFAKGMGEVVSAAVDVAYSNDMQHVVGQGAQEIAAALFSGNDHAFVMYPRSGNSNEGPEQTQSQEVQPSQEMGQEMERGGRGM